jgi:hypothetical protein
MQNRAHPDIVNKPSDSLLMFLIYTLEPVCQQARAEAMVALLRHGQMRTVQWRFHEQ